MRIVAGTARGRALRTPKGPGIRPTADRVRETLFNVLGQWLDGERVLDLYAGTGALAFEALSRGAGRAVLVDSGREALRLCRENAEALGFSDRVEIKGVPVDRALQQLGREGQTFDLIFADPPYAARAVKSLLEAVADRKLLSPEGTLVIEHDRRDEAPEVLGPLKRVDERRFGDTVITLYRFA